MERRWKNDAWCEKRDESVREVDPLSGGTFEGDWSEWRLTEVASRIEEENPLFGKLLMDVNKLIGRYDYYIAGDIGKEDIAEAWKSFREKWLVGDVGDVVKDEVRKSVDSYLQRSQDGYDGSPRWWEVGYDGF